MRVNNIDVYITKILEKGGRKMKSVLSNSNHWKAGRNGNTAASQEKSTEGEALYMRTAAPCATQKMPASM